MTVIVRVLGSRPRPGMGMFGVKTWLLTLGLCDHVNIGPVSFNWGHKRIIEDDMHPQCHHIKVSFFFRVRVNPLFKAYRLGVCAHVLK